MVGGVVLAGGESRRMGRDKALVEVGGKPMIAWVVAALEAAGLEVLIAGKPEGWDGRQGLPDPPGLAGPLAGLVAALSEGVDVLLVGVDQPWVQPETLTRLIERPGTAVPIDQGLAQVTCARYASSLIDAAAQATSLQDLLVRVQFRAVEASEWKAWGEDGRSWFSVDSPQALAEGMDRFGPLVPS